MQELIRLLPDGASTVGVIIVVMLFLKQQDHLNLMLESITKNFNGQVHDSHKSFHEQTIQLTRQHHDNQKLCHDQIQSLFDSHLRESRDMIIALKSLESSLKLAKERGSIKVA